jgi:hypothetical protein
MNQPCYAASRLGGPFSLIPIPTSPASVLCSLDGDPRLKGHKEEKAGLGQIGQITLFRAYRPNELYAPNRRTCPMCPRSMVSSCLLTGRKCRAAHELRSDTDTASEA